MESKAAYNTGRPHRYLMDEHPHFFYPTLAEHLGLNEAIVIQQIHGWFQTYAKDPDTYKRQHWRDGAWWIWNSYPEWHQAIPYLSEHTIRRTLVNLREQGLLKTANHNYLKIDRTLWYTIDYEAYDKFWADQEAKMDRPSAQNGQMEEANLDRPLPVPSSVSSSVGEGATAPPAPEDELWPDDVAALGEEEPPREPTGKRQVERMRSKMGSDPFSVGAYCQGRQEQEGTWTVPVHRGLSPACAVVKEATGYSPPVAVRAVLDQTIPKDLEALERWFETCQGWMLCGNKYNNYSGMLEWYAQGRTGYDAPQGGRKAGGPSTPRQQEQGEKIEAAINALFDETGRRRELA